MMNLSAIQPKNRDASEAIICLTHMRSLIDFWHWAYSELNGNTERGVLAEYLVALACGIDHNPRISWDAYDLKLDDGTKIEVKASGFLQTWEQKKLSRASFRIPKTHAWDPITGIFDSEQKRQADIYVFALHAHEVQETINALDTNQWEFYILKKAVLDSEMGDKKQISLKKITTLNPIKCDFEHLFDGIKQCVSTLVD